MAQNSVLILSMDLKLDDWDSFLYESRPYAYVALGIYVLLVDKPNILLVGFSAILIFCGVLVLRARFTHRKVKSLESLFYESLPFLYLGLGVYALVFLNASKLGVGSGMLLLFCATKVFQWRIRSRRAMTSYNPIEKQ